MSPRRGARFQKVNRSAKTLSPDFTAGVIDPVGMWKATTVPDQPTAATVKEMSKPAISATTNIHLRQVVLTGFAGPDEKGSPLFI
jgi:hypothetical protein